MKKIMNRPGDIVTEMLRGLELSDPRIVSFPEDRVAARREKTEKVGVVTCGGSGHEPSSAGYVGKGMLDASVAGNIFASPSPTQMLRGIQEANTGRGVLMILMNYTGDLMNFSMAKELAELEGIEVDSVVVKDDVATPDSGRSAGRRGIAGTVLVHKIAGAMAERGAGLAEVRRAAEKAIGAVHTMGMSMTACTLPGLEKPGFTLGDDEIEFGMGIHGEPGIEKTQMKTSKEIAEKLVGKILEDCGGGSFRSALMVNGLGATPLIELYVLANDVSAALCEKKIDLGRVFVGNYMTSLDMAGCSVTLMKLDEELEALLDDPCDTPALKIIGQTEE